MKYIRYRYLKWDASTIHTCFCFIMSSSDFSPVESPKLEVERLAIVITMFNAITHKTATESILPHETMNVINCRCDEGKDATCRHAELVFTPVYERDGSVTVFSQEITDNRTDRREEFIANRKNEIERREDDIRYEEKVLSDASLELAMSLADDHTVDNNIAEKILQIRGVIANHKMMIAQLEEIENIPYEETTRRTSVTIRVGEQSPFITHVDDPMGNLYSFLLIRIPDIGTPLPVDTKVTRQLTNL